LYCITDVEDLHHWHVEKCDSHPMFRKLGEEELEGDVCVEAMTSETEESKKVDRAGTAKYFCVYERVGDVPALDGSFWDDGQFGVVCDES